MELSNIIFSFILLIFGFFLNKYALKSLKVKNKNLFIDDDYRKPQAFHTNKVYRLGGTTSFFLLLLSSLYLFYTKNIYLSEYIPFCSAFFILGLMDDLKIKILPKFRLFTMTGILLVLIISNELYIKKSGLEFLDHLLAIDIFAVCFVALCFLFIINGSNLIDGFNGLLSIHTVIILIILLVINLIGKNDEISIFLFYLILIVLIFLKFNFPKAQMFLGDSGAYFWGALISISVIKTSELNPGIPPFFFCILLSYLFFEVFFSFFRKIFVAKQSPLLPDNKHLHMNLYKFLLKKNKSKLNSNYSVSLYINGIYLLLLFPTFVFIQNGEFCRIYFFILLTLYIYFYKKLSKKY